MRRLRDQGQRHGGAQPGEENDIKNYLAHYEVSQNKFFLTNIDFKLFQDMNIPECPRNWDSLWIGYSFAMVRTNCLKKPHNLNLQVTLPLYAETATVFMFYSRCYFHSMSFCMQGITFSIKRNVILFLSLVEVTQAYLDMINSVLALPPPDSTPLPAPRAAARPCPPPAPA